MYAITVAFGVINRFRERRFRSSCRSWLNMLRGGIMGLEYYPRVLEKLVTRRRRDEISRTVYAT
jgi:hypothetical protein